MVEPEREKPGHKARITGHARQEGLGNSHLFDVVTDRLSMGLFSDEHEDTTDDEADDDRP